MSRKEIKELIDKNLALERMILSEPEAKGLLALGAVPVPRFIVVEDVNAVVDAAEGFGYPLVLKVISHNIRHKSDVGGVSLDIKDPEELSERLSLMLLHIADESPTSIIEGFVLEEMLPKGVEVIVGAIKDDRFGVVVIFGTGGVTVELMSDVSFRLAPVKKDEVIEMIKEVRGFALLEGQGGESARDIDAVAELIGKVARIVEETDRLKELEINPLIVYEEGVVAVDAHAVLE
jgi:acetyl-CoA synthetase (ADP-forming)